MKIKLKYTMLGNNITTSTYGITTYTFKIGINREVSKGFAVNLLRTQEKLLKPLTDLGFCVLPYYKKDYPYNISLVPSYIKKEGTFEPMLVITFPQSSKLIRKAFSEIEFEFDEDPIVFCEEGDLTDFEPVDQKKHEKYEESRREIAKREQLQQLKEQEEYEKGKAAEAEAKTTDLDEQEEIEYGFEYDEDGYDEDGYDRYGDARP